MDRDADLCRPYRELIAAIQQLSPTQDFAAVALAASRTAPRLVDGDSAAFLVAETGYCYCSDGSVIPNLVAGGRFGVHARACRWVQENGGPLHIHDVHGDPRLVAPGDDPAAVGSMAAVAVGDPDAPLAALSVAWHRGHAVSPVEVQLLQLLAGATAAAMDWVATYQSLDRRAKERTDALERLNRQLGQEVAERRKAEQEVRQLSLVDPLTGLFNRRGFLDRAEQELRHTRRTGELVSLVFADVDGLKRVNDTLGHEQGDRLIKDAGEVLAGTLRRADVVARLGGDEFAVLVVDDGHPQVIERRIREGIAAFNARQQRPYALSLSVGVTPASGNERTIGELLTDADARMYRQKHAKRRTGEPQPTH